MDEIAALLEPHIPALRRYAWALLRDGDAADDLVQDCLERALARWRLRRRDGNLRAWLFTIQRNLFLSGLRRGGAADRMWTSTRWPRSRRARQAKTAS